MNTTNSYKNKTNTIPIPIKQNLSTLNEYNNILSEYSLKQNCFDPSKSSPPNKFMMKLHMRMCNYTSLFTNEDNRESE
jgi:hypothetical protein